MFFVHVDHPTVAASAAVVSSPRSVTANPEHADTGRQSGSRYGLKDRFVDPLPAADSGRSGVAGRTLRPTGRPAGPSERFIPNNSK
jgi:hypothetical protein